MAIDPQYGVSLSANELTTQIPSSVLYGVTSANKFIPIKISADGTLSVIADLDTSDIEIGAVEIKNSTTDDRLAVDASGRISVNVNTLPAISGSVSVSNFPASYPVTGAFWQTTQPVSIDGSANSYYQDQVATALTGSFVLQSFGFSSISILIVNDETVSGGYVEYSFDGTNVHGKLLPGESRSMDFRKQIGIYLKGQVGGEQYRLEVY